MLIVSITSDAAIDKESDRPYIPEELRAENLAALSFVDLVYVDPNHTAEQVLQLVGGVVRMCGSSASKP